MLSLTTFTSSTVSLASAHPLRASFPLIPAPSRPLAVSSAPANLPCLLGELQTDEDFETWSLHLRADAESMLDRMQALMDDVRQRIESRISATRERRASRAAKRASSAAAPSASSAAAPSAAPSADAQPAGVHERATGAAPAHAAAAAASLAELAAGLAQPTEPPSSAFLHLSPGPSPSGSASRKRKSPGGGSHVRFAEE